MRPGRGASFWSGAAGASALWVLGHDLVQVWAHETNAAVILTLLAAFLTGAALVPWLPGAYDP